MCDSDAPRAHPSPGCSVVDLSPLPPLPLPRECRNTVPDNGLSNSTPEDAIGELNGRAPTEPSESGYDPVRRPEHYARLRPEPLEVIEAWDLPHHEACALKYIARAGHKGDAVRDLEKAINYLARKRDMLRRRNG